METPSAPVFLLRPWPHFTATAASDIISLVSEKSTSSQLCASKTTLPFNTIDIGFSGVS